MQNTADQDSAGFLAEKYYVPAFLDATHTYGCPITGAAYPWVAREQTETLFKFIKLAIGLCLTPGLHGVYIDA